MTNLIIEGKYRLTEAGKFYSIAQNSVVRSSTIMIAIMPENPRLPIFESIMNAAFLLLHSNVMSVVRMLKRLST